MTDSIDLFDRELKALFKESLEILNCRYGVSASLGKVRKEITYLERYQSIYKATTPDEHHIYFENLFEEKRRLIFKTLTNDTWLKEGNVVIQFGEGFKGLSEKCKDIKILLSNIYNCAIELQDSAQKIAANLSEECAQNKDLIRPSIFLLHLMRIFYVVADEHDKKPVGDIITTLENDLNIKVKTVKPEGTFNATPGDSGLETIFNVAKGAMKLGGLEVSDDIQAPTVAQFGEVLQTLFSNDGTRSLFQKFSDSLKNNDDMETTVQNLLRTAVDPETMQSIQQSFMQTAEIAKENTLAERTK